MEPRGGLATRPCRTGTWPGTERGSGTQNRREHLAKPGALACEICLPLQIHLSGCVGPGQSTARWALWGGPSAQWVAGRRQS